MDKHEWRKKEKDYYLPKNRPEVIEIPTFKFLTIEGEGNPNSSFFSNYISVLYSVSYAIKMGLKKMDSKPKGYCDYTVYPLEGVWDIKEEARKTFDGTLDKNDLVFKLMIRQPNFVNRLLFIEMLEITEKKKPNNLLKSVQFERITDGKSVQMLHIGNYDDEPESFLKMEKYAEEINLKRLSKTHREIYLSDFRKVAPEKLKTVLRFKVG